MFLNLALSVLSCLPGPSDRPPPLTFDTHVDYVARYKDFVSKGKKENAYELYPPLERNSKGQVAGPRLPSQIAHQFAGAMHTVWRAEDHPELVTYIQENRRFVEAFKKAQERRDYWIPPPAERKELPHWTSSQFEGMCETANIILVDAMREQPNHGEALIEAWSIVLGNAAHLRQAQLATSQAEGAWRRECVYDKVRLALARKLVQGEDIERTVNMITRADPGEVPSAGWGMLDWAAQLDGLQASCPNGAPLKVEVYPLAGPFKEASGPSEIRFEDPVNIAKVTDEHYSSIRRALSGPIGAETARELRRLDQEQVKRSGGQDAAHVRCGPSAPVYDLLLRVETQRRATLLCLALHAHKESRGDWPKTLDELAPPFGVDVIQKILIDPYSGKRFVYTLKDGQPLLYSIATDGDDDEGRHDAHWGDGPDGGDFVFWPYQGPRTHAAEDDQPLRTKPQKG
jgi:hypothetical protein